MEADGAITEKMHLSFKLIKKKNRETYRHW